MSKNCRVVVVEDDPFARDQLLNLLSRDWRTQVVGEFDSFSKKDFREFVSDPDNRIDAVILDTEVPWNPNWPIEAFEILCTVAQPPKLVFLCTFPVARYWNDVLFSYDFYGGYLVKQEILYSIPSAIVLSTQGHLVCTDSIQDLKAPLQTRKGMLVLDGARSVYQFTDREQEIVRLSIFYDHSHRDIEDELSISRDWISELLSSIYEKLGIPALIAGEIPLEDVFIDDTLFTRSQKIIAQIQEKSSKNLRRIPWLSTLAFHILTRPEIRKV
jgi:DNA-binding NarL/FixJ family response regulator